MSRQTLFDRIMHGDHRLNRDKPESPSPKREEEPAFAGIAVPSLQDVFMGSMVGRTIRITTVHDKKFAGILQSYDARSGWFTLILNGATDQEFARLHMRSVATITPNANPSEVRDGLYHTLRKNVLNQVERSRRNSSMLERVKRRRTRVAQHLRSQSQS